LMPVDRPELALGVGPRVPDPAAERLRVCLATQEPEELLFDRLEDHLLRRDQREALAQVVACLQAEERERAGAGAIGPPLAVIEHLPQEIEVGLHRAASACRHTPAAATMHAARARQRDRPPNAARGARGIGLPTGFSAD